MATVRWSRSREELCAGVRHALLHKLSAKPHPVHGCISAIATIQINNTRARRPQRISHRTPRQISLVTRRFLLKVYSRSNAAMGRLAFFSYLANPTIPAPTMRDIDIIFYEVHACCARDDRDNICEIAPSARQCSQFSSLQRDIGLSFLRVEVWQIISGTGEPAQQFITST